MHAREMHLVLSIREVKWISYFCYTFKDDLEKLVGMALTYAQEEIIEEAGGRSPLLGNLKGILNLYQEYTGKIIPKEIQELLLSENNGSRGIQRNNFELSEISLHQIDSRVNIITRKNDYVIYLEPISWTKPLVRFSRPCVLH